MCFSAMLKRMYGLQAFSNTSNGVAPALWARVETAGGTHAHQSAASSRVSNCLVDHDSRHGTLHNNKQIPTVEGQKFATSFTDEIPRRTRNWTWQNNKTRPLTPCIQCWQWCAWVGVAKFSPFAQPPFTTSPARQHWMTGVRGMQKDHLLHPLHKCARCELLSVNSPRHAGLALDACMHTTRKAHTHCGSNGKTNLKTLSQLARQWQHYKTRLIH